MLTFVNQINRMKIISLLTIASLLIFASCNNSSNPDKKILAPYKANLKEFKNADYSFGTNNNYFRMKNFDYNSLADTLEKCHAHVFKDKSILKAINNDVRAWLRDSLFIGVSNTRKGKLIVDTTNTLFWNPEDEFQYYNNVSVTSDQKLNGKMFQLTHAMHTAHVNGKEVYYDIIPANAKKLASNGKYRIVTNTEGSIFDQRNFCDLYAVDWFIVFYSDYFFEGELAIKISDETFYYDPFKTK